MPMTIPKLQRCGSTFACCTIIRQIITAEGQSARALEKEIRKAFPDSTIVLKVIDDKWAVGGEAKDLNEALQILRILRANALPHLYALPGINSCAKTDPNPETLENAGGPNVINLLRVAAPKLPSLVVMLPPSLATMPAADTAGKSSAMNLADVVALSISNVSDQIILNQLRTTGATFSLGAEEIIGLKKNGVSDQVVIAMQNTRPATKNNCTAEPMPRLIEAEPWVPAPGGADCLPESLRMPRICPPMP